MLKQAVDNFRGGGTASVAIPIFDGPLKPNNSLDEARTLAEGSGFSAIAACPAGGVYAACSRELVQIRPDGHVESLASFDSPIRAIDSCGEVLAVATEECVVLRGGKCDGVQLRSCGDQPLGCLNAVTFGEDGELYVSQGSTVHGNDQWKHDLMTGAATGRVLKFDPDREAVTVVADGLRYCYGVCVQNGRVLASESWAHRVVDVSDGHAVPVLSDLAGYPASIVRAENGGYWLSLFAKRTQLIELVLRERVYREEMMRTIPPQYWIAPSLSSGKDFLEPLQFGAVRQMGIFKPWAPTSSYGIAIRLNDDFNPLYAFHSRAGGINHGTTGAVESGGSLYVLSRGGDRILQLSPLPTADNNRDG